MSEPAVPPGSEDNPIIIDDDDHLQQKPEKDDSDADTIRMGTHEYEQWTNDNCPAVQQNVLLTESTPSSTFLKYHSCTQSDCTGVSQTPAPLAEVESKKVEGFKQEKLVLGLTPDVFCVQSVQYKRISPSPSINKSKSAIKGNPKSLRSKVSKMRSESGANFSSRRSKRLILKNERKQ